MIRQYEIRHRSIEVSTQLPEEVIVDAILLPFRPLKPEEKPTGILRKAGLHVTEEIADYHEEREVMLTSAGVLPARFFFLLGMPAEGKSSADQIEERFRDCLFQSGVLGLSDLAVPINEFAPYAASFSELVGAIWLACREFLSRERGPQRITFLVEERDLSGQFLRHFFQRKEAQERSWDQSEPAAPVRTAPVQARPLPSRERCVLGDERVLTLDIGDEEEAGTALASLLEAYRGGKPLDAALARLGPPMRGALGRALSSGEDLSVLPTKLRILGSDLAMRLPWELIAGEEGYLAQSHRFTRGTNFLHFRTDRGAARERGFRICLRVLGKSENARRIAEELRILSRQGKQELKWSTEQDANVRLIHCLGRPAAEELLEEMPLACELAFLELEDQDIGRPGADFVEDWSRQLLTHGCRRVLAPLSPFRSEEERHLFRRVFYESLLVGASAGRALQGAQEILHEQLGPRSGWWLYRIFGQTDEALVPAREVPSPASCLNSSS